MDGALFVKHGCTIRGCIGTQGAGALRVGSGGVVEVVDSVIADSVAAFQGVSDVSDLSTYAQEHAPAGAASIRHGGRLVLRNMNISNCTCVGSALCAESGANAIALQPGGVLQPGGILDAVLVRISFPCDAVDPQVYVLRGSDPATMQVRGLQLENCAGCTTNASERRSPCSKRRRRS